jgi:hypothetical protein
MCAIQRGLLDILMPRQKPEAVVALAVHDRALFAQVLIRGIRIRDKAGS